MNVGKLLFWIVIIIAVLFVARIAARMAAARDARPASPPPKPPAQPGGGAEAMVRCAHCGIHLPRSEALLQNGRTWCSADHAQRGPTSK
nr:PP0621 family protein [Achromobacter sp. Marseille-Q0513]